MAGAREKQYRIEAGVVSRVLSASPGTILRTRQLSGRMKTITSDEYNDSHPYSIKAVMIHLPVL